MPVKGVLISGVVRDYEVTFLCQPGLESVNVSGKSYLEALTNALSKRTSDKQIIRYEEQRKH